MATQTEDAILNVKINGQDAISTFTQLNQLRAEQIKLVKNLNENTPEYDEQSRKLELLNTQYAAWRSQIYGVTEASGALASELRGGLVTALETLGVSLGVSAIANFSKELISLQGTASGVEMAFAKIGDTTGMLDKLRTASRGLMSDLNLEKLAVRANEANIPLDKMSTFLAFATQRAKDTGQSVDELTEKIITGLAKGTPKALSGLGINVQEVKDDFKQTGDMVTTVANIINRQMGQAGTDVETFGDKAATMASKWENLKTKMGGILQSILMPQLADPEVVEQKTNEAMKQYDGYQKFSDKQLKDAISKQTLTAQLNKKANDNAQAAFNSLNDNAGFFGKIANTVSSKMANAKATAKSEAEDYQAARSVLDALQKELEKREAKTEHTEKTPGQVNAAKLYQEELLRQKAAYLQQSKDLTTQYDQFMDARATDMLSKNAKEVKNEQNKYDREIENLQKFIDQAKTKQEDARNNSKLTPAQKADTISTAQGEIDKHQGQIDTLKVDRQKATNDILAKQAADLTETIKKYQDDQSVNFSGNLDKELQKNNDFYNGLRKQLAGDDWLGMIEIESARIASNAKITATAALAEQKKYEEELQKLKDEDAVYNDDHNISEKAKLQLKYDQELAMFKNQLQKKEITQQQFDLLAAQSKKNFDDASAKADEEKFNKYKDMAIAAVEKAESTAFTIAQNTRNADLAAESTKIEKQRKEELSSVGLSASQKAAINAKYDAEEAAAKLKKWQADKDASLEQAVIGTALGIVKAIPDVPQEIAAAAAGAAQIAVIASSKPPTFGDGGILPDGPSHSAGGLNVVDPLGNLVANIEGGEPILSKKTAAANPNLVNALLGSRGQTLNYERILNAATTSRTGAPAYSGGQSSAGSTGYNHVSSSHAITTAHLDRMEALYKQAMNLIMASDSKPVILSNRVLTDHNTKNTQITDSVNG